MVLPLLFAGITALLLFLACLLIYAGSSTVRTGLKTANMMFLSGDASAETKAIFDGVVEWPDSDTVPASEIDYPVSGDLFGTLTIAEASVDCSLYFGDTNACLKKGAGVSTSSFAPGMQKTTLVGGHNNTVFNALKNAEVGQKIEIVTAWGEYEYTISDIQIMTVDEAPVDEWLSRDYENLILYTCYPFNTLGLTNYRCFVFGEYVSGPKIDLAS